VPVTSGIGQRARALAALMRTKAVFLGQQSAAGSSRTDDRLALLEQRLRLMNLTVNLPLLEAALAVPVLQPLPLYVALCAQLGALAALRPGAVPLAPPAYVHADSYAAFDAVLANLEDLASEVNQTWKSSVFNFDGEIFALPMRPEWMGARLVVGLRGDSEREMAQWMAGAAIGSRTVSASLRDRRVPGAVRTPIDGAPELGLRGGNGCLLFAITVDEHFIVANQDLLISNDNALLQVQHPQEIVLYFKG
jgi:type VI secretion system protein ImpJ